MGVQSGNSAYPDTTHTSLLGKGGGDCPSCENEHNALTPTEGFRVVGLRVLVVSGLLDHVRWKKRSKVIPLHAMEARGVR
jgi:hypothetical protein